MGNLVFCVNVPLLYLWPPATLHEYQHNKETNNSTSEAFLSERQEKAEGQKSHTVSSAGKEGARQAGKCALSPQQEAEGNPSFSGLEEPSEFSRQLHSKKELEKFRT